MGNGAMIGSALGGALGGAVLAWLAMTAHGEAPMAPRAGARSAEAAPPGDDAPGAVPAAQRNAPAAAPAPIAVGREAGELVTAALLEHARREFVRGWRDVRADGPPGEAVEAAVREYQTTVETLAHELGRRAAARHSEDEAKAALLAGDDLGALLDAVEAHDPGLPAFVDAPRFATLFAPRGGGSVVDGTSLERGRGVADGAVVAFPAGVFTLPNLNRTDGYPSDVTVRGAGMDATLLVASSQGWRGPFTRLVIEDCTVHAADLVDARQGPATLCLRRVRLVGFDTGAGGSTALSASGGCAMLATDCRFESGYGRHPGGHANLLSARGARLVRFERCVAERISLADADVASVLFVDCTFTEMLHDQPQGPTFRNCRWTTMASEHRWDAAHQRRDLNLLFPDWERRLERR